MTKNRIPRVYIAGRFRGADNAEVQRNIDVASWFQAPIAAAGAMPVCVHAMEGLKMHDVQQEDNGAFWLQATMDELRTCDAVVLIPGWQTSMGTWDEVQTAFMLDIPVFEAGWRGVVWTMALPEVAHMYAWERVVSLVGTPGAAMANLAEFGDFELWLEEVLR